MSPPAWARSKWIFALVIASIIIASVLASLVGIDSEDKGHLVATMTYFNRGTKNVRTRYSFFSNGRMEKFYYTGGPPSLRWTKPEKIQDLVSVLNNRVVWNRTPKIHKPLTSEEQEFLEVKFGGNTNLFLAFIKTNHSGLVQYDEVIQVIQNGKTNSATLHAGEHLYQCLRDTDHMVARRECSLIWNTADSGVWQSIKKLFR